LKDGWTQERKMLERICGFCFRPFKCTGKCGNSRKLESKGACVCPEHADDSVLAYRTAVCKNYKNLEPDEVFESCYGYERGMEAEK